MLVKALFLFIFSNSFKIYKKPLNLLTICTRYKCSVPIILNGGKKNIWHMSLNENSSNNSLELPSTSDWCNSSFEDKELPSISLENGFRRSRSVDNLYHPNSSYFVENPLPIVGTGLNLSNIQTYIGIEFPMQGARTDNYYKQQNLSRRYIQRGGESLQKNMISGRDEDKKLLSLRMWENTTNEKLTGKPGYTFTLLSYNVLAQDLLEEHLHLYQFHNQHSLQWYVRWNNLFKEFKRLSPDILCLQEVQESHITDYYLVLDALGYRSIYKKRTRERTDGCLIFYKTECLNLIEYIKVEYFHPNILTLNRDNIGIVAKFSPKMHPTREFVVATTHLLYNPRREDVRLAQMQLLLTEIERISFNDKANNNYLPIILTGDLNSPPESALYDLVTKGKVNYGNLPTKYLTDGTLLIPTNLRITDNCQHVDLIQMRFINENKTRDERQSIGEENKTETSEKAKLFGTGTLRHNFAFRSVYTHGTNDNNEGTTFQGKWLTVDYIFYSTRNDTNNSEDKIKLLSRYRLPTVEELNNIKIPNTVVGSDHLSLVAKFKLEF